MIEFIFIMIFAMLVFFVIIFYKQNQQNDALRAEVDRLNIIRKMVFQRLVDDSGRQDVANALERNARNSCNEF